MSNCAWESVPRSRVYMADLESALHYSLRVEVAAHTVIEGQELVSLKKYIAVLAKVREHIYTHTIHGLKPHKM